MKIIGQDITLHGREALKIGLSQIQTTPANWSGKQVWFEVNGLYRTLCTNFPSDDSGLLLTLSVEEGDQLPSSFIDYILLDNSDPDFPVVLVEGLIRRSGFTIQPQTIDQVPELSISGAPSGAIVGANPIFAPAIAGGFTPYTLTLLTGSLPAGRAISGLTVTGIYTANATYSYTLRVTDFLGHHADLNIVNETVSAHAPANTTVPVVSGTATEGQTLSVSTGTWLYNLSIGVQTGPLIGVQKGPL